MNIRKARLEDIDNNLSNLYIKEFKFHLNNRLDIFEDKKDIELINELKEEINNIYVCEDTNIVGFIMFHIKEKGLKKVMWINQLYVDESMRKKGIARLLIDKINDIGKEENCKRFELNCWSFNTNASELYKHLGFNEQKIVYEKEIK